MKISLISLDAFIGSLGLRSISSYVKQRGHAVKMIFLIPHERYDYDSIFPDNILDQLAELVDDSDIIGISSMTNESKKAIQVINYLKKLNKPIVWGGIHATSCPDECIKYADIVCLGEGEEAFCELVETIEKKQDYFDIKNYWFKKNEHTIKNPVRPLIQDLDSLPFLDFESDSHYVLKNNEIINAAKDYETLSTICIHTTRGCPNACTYCCNSFLQKLYQDKGKIIRKKSIESIIEELELHKSKFPNLSFVWFTDDTMFIKTLQELELFSREYKEKIGLPFECYGSPNTINEEKLKLLLSAGLRKIEMGIQTGSENINKNLYNRKISNAVVMKAAEVISGFATKMDYPNYQIIFCNPYERAQDLLETIVFLKKIPPPFFLQIFALQFFPASGLYEKAKQDGLLQKRFFVNYHDHNKALTLNNKERYLNFLICLMEGLITSKKMGRIPRYLLPILLNTKFIFLFNKNNFILNKIINFYFKNNKAYR